MTLTILGLVLVLGSMFAFRSRCILQAEKRCVLFRGYQTYSLSVMLFSLLVFLGCGSFLSWRFFWREVETLPLAMTALGFIVSAYIYGLPVVQDALLGSPMAIGIAVTLAALLSLGLLLGIRIASEVHSDLVPWA